MVGTIHGAARRAAPVSGNARRPLPCRAATLLRGPLGRDDEHERHWRCARRPRSPAAVCRQHARLRRAARPRDPRGRGVQPVGRVAHRERRAQRHRRRGGGAHGAVDHAARDAARRREHLVLAAASRQRRLPARADRARASCRSSSAPSCSCRRRSISSAGMRGAVRRIVRGVLPHFFEGIYPTGNLSWHHLWFLAHLYGYSILALPLFRYLQHARGSRALRVGGARERRSRAGLLWLALPLVVERSLLWGLFPERHVLTSDWSNHALLFVAYVYGFVLAGTPWLGTVIDAQWRARSSRRRSAAGDHDRRVGRPAPHPTSAAVLPGVPGLLGALCPRRVGVDGGAARLRAAATGSDATGSCVGTVAARTCGT